MDGGGGEMQRIARPCPCILPHWKTWVHKHQTKKRGLGVGGGRPALARCLASLLSLSAAWGALGGLR